MSLNNGDTENTQEKKDWKKEIISWLKIIIICVCISLFINNVILINADVPSGSMENVVMTNDRFFGTRLSYKFKDPKRFDMIVFKHPDNDEDLLLKRVIGIPNDKVEIIDGLLYINDEIIEESYLKEAPYTLDFGPYYVPEDHYFALGDNRNVSIDSRMWENTFIPKDNIVAKPFLKYYKGFELLINK